jgi:hypothetical protein
VPPLHRHEDHQLFESCLYQVGEAEGVPHSHPYCWFVRGDITCSNDCTSQMMVLYSSLFVLVKVFFPFPQRSGKRVIYMRFRCSADRKLKIKRDGSSPVPSGKGGI